MNGPDYDAHELQWTSTGVTDFRWECACGFRPAVNWPDSSRTWQTHLEDAS